MFAHAPAVLFAMFLWWFSTGAILYVDGLPRRTFNRSLALASVASGLAAFALVATAEWTTPTGAYVAFGSAIAIWAWHELGFLMGVVTGPRREPCPLDATGWRRFRLATSVVIHHEVALALTWAAIVLVTWGAPNQVGTWTFTVLWVMRLSAKLNIFFGVSNLSEEFIPDHLRYMQTYFRRASFNWLMPFSLVASAYFVVRLVFMALSSPGGSFGAVAPALVGTMLALALLEHLFLVIPFPDTLLWKWALRSHARRRAMAAAAD